LAARSISASQLFGHPSRSVAASLGIFTRFDAVNTRLDIFTAVSYVLFAPDTRSEPASLLASFEHSFAGQQFDHKAAAVQGGVKLIKLTEIALGTTEVVSEPLAPREILLPLAVPGRDSQ
jgi:hypothetical protein